LLLLAHVKVNDKIGMTWRRLAGRWIFCLLIDDEGR
jgi:hypothetical protein